MAHVVIMNFAGAEVAGPKEFPEPPTGAMLRRLVFDSGKVAAGARFKLLHGVEVLKNGEVIKGGSSAAPVMLTLVNLPPAGASEEAQPIVLKDEDGGRLNVEMLDLRSGEKAELPFRYFLAQDISKYRLGVLAVELAPMIGADALSLARVATVKAVFEGEEGARPEEVAAEGGIWQVVGGAGLGGILVREGKETASSQLPERLETGSLLRELAFEGGRLQYSLLSGSGPSSGWVSVRLKDKELVVKADEAFRAVVQTQDLPAAIGMASPTWRRRSSFVDIAMAISLRIDLVAMDVDNKDMSDAIDMARSCMSGWWSSG